MSYTNTIASTLRNTVDAKKDSADCLSLKDEDDDGVEDDNGLSLVAGAVTEDSLLSSDTDSDRAFCNAMSPSCVSTIVIVQSDSKGSGGR